MIFSKLLLVALACGIVWAAPVLNNNVNKSLVERQTTQLERPPNNPNPQQQPQPPQTPGAGPVKGAQNDSGGAIQGVPNRVFGALGRAGGAVDSKRDDGCVYFRFGLSLSEGFAALCR